MIPSRATQPYRKGPRHPGLPLQAMRRGRPFYAPNPADVIRATNRLAQPQQPGLLAELLRRRFR